MAEAYVHITLPEAALPITAGRFVMETDRTRPSDVSSMAGATWRILTPLKSIRSS